MKMLETEVSMQGTTCNEVMVSSKRGFEEVDQT